ncbi:hypothetical protein HRG_009960 [Hirsutella rhossiliensis]|uniref:Uncharacterized protein n=1 Tax=Hirsutella rhossiliensis TaxID=111463 RepID=A0A9P8MPI4_9HYPO|nr:uncharacterized protein HRG_09960 [Hirsutella rhossiliensis]KAH0958915.1 hypothetical protein HRG_09960 [Hirsutella rhossiliensis]
MSGASLPQEASEALEEYWGDEHGLNKGLFKELGVVSKLAVKTYGSPAAAVGPVNVCLAECCIALTKLLRLPETNPQAHVWNQLLRIVAVAGQLTFELRVQAGDIRLPTVHLERQAVVLSVSKSHRFHYESHLEELFRVQALATVDIDPALGLEGDSCNSGNGDPGPRARRLTRVAEVTGAFNPPYHLRIFWGDELGTGVSKGGITIEGNHADSVVCILTCLRKFICDEKTRAAPPFLEVSPAMKALHFDDIKVRVTANENDQGVDARQSLPFLFQLAEGFLGYRRVHTGHEIWEYRTDAPFEGPSG